ncbi:MAG: Hsp20/alpha crystallin family protein [Candidatus Thermoplasmatota archaeon]
MAWNMMQDMERRFDDLRRELLGSTESGALVPWSGAVSGIRAPLADIVDDGTEFVLTAELPGVRKKDITLDVQPDSIRIRAQAQTAQEKKEKNWVRRERSTFAYDRYVELPEEVSPDQSSAKFEDGVLTVHIHKVEPSKRSAHRVEIS